MSNHFNVKARLDEKTCHYTRIVHLESPLLPSAETSTTAVTVCETSQCGGSSFSTTLARCAKRKIRDELRGRQTEDDACTLHNRDGSGNSYPG